MNFIIQSFSGTFDEVDLDLLTDEQLLMAMGAVSAGVEQMAQDVLVTRDTDKAATLLDTMDNLLGRFGNMSAVTPEQFTSLAKGTFLFCFLFLYPIHYYVFSFVL